MKTKKLKNYTLTFTEAEIIELESAIDDRIMHNKHAYSKKGVRAANAKLKKAVKEIDDSYTDEEWDAKFADESDPVAYRISLKPIWPLKGE